MQNRGGVFRREPTIQEESLNRTARDSYTHAPEPACRSVRYARENSGVQGRRAHSARYAECANLMHLGLGGEKRPAKNEELVRRYITEISFG